jgi:hypothetical protein
MAAQDIVHIGLRVAALWFVSPQPQQLFGFNSLYQELV